MAVAVDIEDVSKVFRLYHSKYPTLKERVVHFGQVPHEKFWALRDVNIEIKEGETVGLLGHNGSGKSTLLKCIAGILRPTEGTIRTLGRLAALLELGAGFHPELTGRENIFLNGAILGFSRRDIERRFDDIVAFAEIEPFIDNQVRNYSSGMYARLGFAVAVNVDPDILVIDEVLSVGDEAFQRKCLDRIKRFQKEGRTIVFVTHAADLVRQICDRACVLDHGRLIMDGTPGEAVREFRHTLLKDDGSPPADTDTSDRRGPSPLHITGVDVAYPASDGRSHLLPEEPLVVTVAYEATTPVDDVVFGIAVYDPDGNTMFGTNTLIEGITVAPVEGRGEISFAFDHVPLLDGTYFITLGAHDTGGSNVYDWREHVDRFEVANPARTDGRVHMPARIEVRKS